MDFVLSAIEKAGYRAGEDVVLALDPAASEFFSGGAYQYKGEGKTRSVDQQVEYLAELCKCFLNAALKWKLMHRTKQHTVFGREFIKAFGFGPRRCYRFFD